jgi:hypothetical protein
MKRDYSAERVSVVNLIEASWERQARRPTAEEINAWISSARNPTIPDASQRTDRTDSVET